jgi:hypothetical protein
MLLPPLALLLAALMPEPAAVQADPAIAARCEVARSVIAGQIRTDRKPVIIVSNTGFIGGDKLNLADFMNGWGRNAKPPRDLAGRFLATPNVDLLASCAELPQALARDGVEFGDEAVTAMIERSRDAQGRMSMVYSSNILGFSLPVISADGQSAMMHSSGTCGALCGSGFVIWLKRDAEGEWKTQNSRMSWIS